MLVFREINFTTTKKVVDAGPIQIDRKEDNSIGWPMYTGGIAVVAGVAVLLLDKKRA